MFKIIKTGILLCLEMIVFTRFEVSTTFDVYSSSQVGCYIA